MTFTESEMESSYLQTVKQRFSAVAERADQLRLNCPYRFYKMSPEAVESWLDKHFVPTELGWTEEKILELEGVLSRIIPNDYRIFLSFLGNLHHQLFGYDYDFSTGQLAFKWRWVRRKVDLRGRSIFRPVGDPISALSPDI
ncbi:hypothetical protein, partial [Deinococcus marmoris]|uniref:hypothetical protein n=1 Tax=Deinococcus marmoris TaxID=249408 RepID=UPI0039F0DF7F